MGRFRNIHARGGLHDLDLFLQRRIVEPEVEHEPVELCLRQRIRPFLFNGVLCREDKEGFPQRIGMSRRRDTVLLHRLEQCRLSFRRGTVDLVGQDNIGKHRTLNELESLDAGGLVLLDDLRTRDVARHQVRSELDTAELQVENLRQCSDQQRLGKPGHPHEEAVAP